jgi:hypothetical protein
MYRGFELDINDWDISTYQAQGLKVFEYFKNKVTPVLDSYIKNNMVLDGDAMRKDWFPEVEADIFISHSHVDANKAICLAGWLYSNFNIIAFIDSMIWNYADNLLLAIDKRYCLSQDESHYIYQKRNYSTSHVHIMLTASLNKMIDKVECFFFIKTPHSITTQKAIEDAKTYSPWIYSEIETSRIIRKKPLRDYRKLNESEIKLFSLSKQKFLNENLKIEHPLDTGHLEEISENELLLWVQQFNSNPEKYPLDNLYDNHPPSKII